MQSDKLTQKSQEALQDAQRIAREHSHQEIDGEHLALALIGQTDSLIPDLLERIGVPVARLKPDLEAELARRHKVQGAGDPYAGNDLRKALDAAQSEAGKLKDEYVSTEHLLLGLLDRGGSSLKTIFAKHGLRRDAVLKALADLRGNQRVTDQNPEDKFQALDKYGPDLTALAKQGKIDPVIGRDEEIRRVMQVLTRRTKNNPVLIGEPGVGKTAIAEGLARRIVSGDVPESLKNKRLVAMDLSAMIAGAKYRGEFENGLKEFFKKITASEGKIILFIDELHTLVGAGAAEGSSDAANIMKPQLARGELRCVGATTLDEYRKHIEKDAALERRFQPVYVGEPSVQDTIAILRGLKERYQVHHKVRIQDSALVAAATLSQRYIADRFLPDKAIDLVDEAASRIRMEIDSKPTEIDEVDRHIMQLEIELQSLGDDDDAGTAARREQLERTLADEREGSAGMHAEWQREKDSLGAVAEVQEQLEAARQELERAQREADLGRAAELQYGTIPELERRLAQAENAEADAVSAGGPAAFRSLKDVVDAEDVAEIVAKWTGVPVTRLLEGEIEKLVHMEGRLHQRVIGQDEAVEAVAAALRRSRAGLQDPDRPIGTFLFLGPTGVGKTELARALAEFMFDTQDAMIRIDMSEYMEKHSVSRLVGAPPGYVGYEEGGQLTEAVRRRPYSVVLLDEIEKAHPDVFNTLLQVMDDGRLTDGQGRTVSFTNTVLIMTSNVGSDRIVGDQVDEGIRSAIEEVLAATFKPEFLNRIADTVIFHRLSKEDIGRIVELQVHQLIGRVAETGIEIELSADARTLLGNLGYDPTYGARPLKRVIQKQLVDKLALKILEGEVGEGDLIRIDAADGELVFERAGAAQAANA